MEENILARLSELHGCVSVMKAGLEALEEAGGLSCMSVVERDLKSIVEMAGSCIPRAE